MGYCYKRWYRWTMRLILAFATAANLRSVVVNWPDARWVSVLAALTVVFVAWCMRRVERTWRDLDALREDRWVRAAASGDPIGYMAGHDYVVGLSGRELQEFAEALRAVPEDSDFEDLPPVVQGYIRAVVDPPREAS